MKLKPDHNNPKNMTKAVEKERADYNTLKKDAEQLNQKYLEAILESANLPIFIKDVDFNYILVNQQYERLADVTRKQIYGKDDFSIFPKPVAQLFREQDEKILKSRTLIEFEETIPLPDGVHSFLTSKFPLIDNNNNIYSLGGICTDITALKRTEAERWLPKFGQCVKVDFRTLTKEYYHEQSETKKIFCRIQSQGCT